jgi:hypothetical protein
MEENRENSVITACFQLEIWRRYVWNNKQESYQADCDVRLVNVVAAAREDAWGALIRFHMKHGLNRNYKNQGRFISSRNGIHMAAFTYFVSGRAGTYRVRNIESL